MKHDIAELKRLLPLDALIAKLGHAPIAQRKARCIFHEDKNASFSVIRTNGGGFHWHCYAGCGSGDEIDFVHKFFDLPDVKAAIERYALLADGYLPTEASRVFQGQVAPAKVVKEPKPIVPAKLEPLTAAAAAKIAEWRGLSPAFVQEMSDKGILGLYDSKPAFVAEGGVQYRIPGDGWRYSMGAKAGLLVLRGAPDAPLAEDRIYVVESNWDALALYESERCYVICTRGAANARLAIDWINLLSGGESLPVVVIPHNDKPGEDWANDLKAGLMLHDFQVKRVPKLYKDFAELHKDKKKQ